MKKFVLQHLVFPVNNELEDNWELFYKGIRGVLDNGILCLPKYAYSDFYTYLNGFSNRKWRMYSNIECVKLILDLAGECEIEYAAFSMPMQNPEKKIYKKVRKSNPERMEIDFDFPSSDEQLLGFEIRCLSECKIYGGHYETEVSEDVINPVELSLATTTCFKEPFIKRNIKAVYDELLNGNNADVKEHLHVHIVDNGRTLNREDFPNSERIELHPNKNVGGSGGFARGMIESLEQTPQATNVLLMDDDVLILPESIYRTFVLLQLEKPECRMAFINGAMLYYEDKNRQLEDTGWINPKALINQKKPHYYLPALHDILDNEKFFPDQCNQYGAWWYCCISTEIIKKTVCHCHYLSESMMLNTVCEKSLKLLQ